MRTDCHVVISVKGQVQGVGYRYATLRMANSLGLTGFAKNQPDGTVYIEAEGSQELILKLIEWCKDGPPRAIVEAVEFTYQPISGFNVFQIR